MSLSPGTRPSLLLRLRDARDGEAWSEFTAIYAPLIQAFALKNGLQTADAEDLVQEVLRRAVSAVPEMEYDPRRGTFRGWLFTVVRNQLRDLWAKQNRKERTVGGSEVLDRLALRPDSENQALQWWEQEHEARLLQYATQQVQRHVQPNTWAAFHRTAVEGREPKEVADALGMSVAAVYLAKGRVIAQLKNCVRELREE